MSETQQFQLVITGKEGEKYVFPQVQGAVKLNNVRFAMEEAFGEEGMEFEVLEVVQ